MDWYSFPHMQLTPLTFDLDLWQIQIEIQHQILHPSTDDVINFSGVPKEELAIPSRWEEEARTGVKAHAADKSVWPEGNREIEV